MHARAATRLLPWLSLFLAASTALAAAKFDLPPIDSHIVDTSGLLTVDDRQALNARAADVQRKSGFDIVVFAAGSLQDQDIADVAYTAFNTWGIGTKEKDNGVLLVWAPKERKLRIETGKGVGGQLTDLQSNEILRQVIEPPLKAGQYRQALDSGILAIANALTGGTYAPTAAPVARARPQMPPEPEPSPNQTLFYGIGVAVFVLLLIVSSTFRSLVGSLFFSFFSGGGSSSGGSSWGGGGDDDSRSGGSGSSGGGGSSDSY